VLALTAPASLLVVLDALVVPTALSAEQTVRRVKVGFKVRDDQAATNEHVGGCDHPSTERKQRSC
jgi:hypothetical protein